MTLFQITRASVLLARKFRCNLTYYESEDFSDSSLHHLFESENVGFLFQERMWRNLSTESRRKRRKSVLHEWNGHLEIFKF